MVLVIGGAYQGKLDCVLEKYNLDEKDVFNCDGLDIDFNKKIINNFEKFILACNKENKEALDVLKEIGARQKKGSIQDLFYEKIIICDDVSQGIVPIEKEERDYREMSGRTLIKLASVANELLRVFCGLECKIK